MEKYEIQTFMHLFSCLMYHMKWSGFIQKLSFGQHVLYHNCWKFIKTYDEFLSILINKIVITHTIRMIKIRKEFKKKKIRISAEFLYLQIVKILVFNCYKIIKLLSIYSFWLTFFLSQIKSKTINLKSKREFNLILR